MQKINFVDQFIMGYGGIRGAVCYGLVMSLRYTLKIFLFLISVVKSRIGCLSEYVCDYYDYRHILYGLYPG